MRAHSQPSLGARKQQTARACITLAMLYYAIEVDANLRTPPQLDAPKAIEAAGIAITEEA